MTVRTSVRGLMVYLQVQGAKVLRRRIFCWLWLNSPQSGRRHHLDDIKHGRFPETLGICYSSLWVMGACSRFGWILGRSCTNSLFCISVDGMKVCGCEDGGKK